MADSVGSGFPTTGINKGHTFYDLDEQSLWMYLNGPPRLASSWIMISGRLSVQPDTTLWGAAQAGAQWFLTSDSQYYGWDGQQIILLSINYSKVIKMSEEFIGGSTANGNVGYLGWGLFGGLTQGVTSSDGSHVGIIRRSTTATINTLSAMYINNGNLASMSIVNQNTYNMLFIVRANNNDVNTLIRIGIGEGVSFNPITSGVYFEKLETDINWFFVVRNAGSEIRLNTNVLVDTVFHSYTILMSSNGIIGKIDNIVVGLGVFSTLSNTLGSPFTQIINSEALAKTLDHDYFELTITGINR